jgi:hypothetical protein
MKSEYRLKYFRSKWIFFGSFILPAIVLAHEYIFYKNNPQSCGFKILHTCSNFREYLSGIYGIEVKLWLLGTFVVSIVIMGVLYFMSRK